MNNYNAYPGLHVYLMSKAEAERFTRQCYNVPPHVGIGWTPYTVLVRSHGGTLAHTAFRSVKALRNWLGGLKLTPAWRHKGFRGFTVA